jgi:type IV secretory pathway VirB10-like protein
MFQEAVKAKTGVQCRCAPRSSGSTPGGRTPATGAPQSRAEVLARISEVQQQIDAQRSNPTAAYQAAPGADSRHGRRRQRRGSGRAAWARAVRRSSCKPRPMRRRATRIGAVRQGGQGDRWKLDSQPEAPRTPFELRAGFVVPATLISGINSDLPGQIMAQVAQDVYDTPTGKHLLIPQGSRLVGSYSSDVKPTARRACWWRGNASCSPMARRWTLARCRARIAPDTRASTTR